MLIQFSGIVCNKIVLKKDSLNGCQTACNQRIAEKVILWFFLTRQMVFTQSETALLSFLKGQHFPIQNCKIHFSVFFHFCSSVCAFRNGFLYLIHILKRNQKLQDYPVCIFAVQNRQAPLACNILKLSHSCIPWLL